MTTKPELLDDAASRFNINNDPAAEYLGIKPHTLEIWRCTGRHRIPYVKVGRLVKYRRRDLDAWLASRTVNAEDAA